MRIHEIIQQTAPVIIDVRTPEEYQRGHVSNSINIPLKEIFRRVDEIKSYQVPIILCCLIGGRSEQARSFLTGRGIECYNGGGWMDVDLALNKCA